MLLSCKSPLSAVTLAQNFQLSTALPAAGDLAKLVYFYKQFHQAFLAGLFKSAHDVGEGGLLIAVAEISVDRMGHEIDVEADWTELFGEGTGHIVVSCSENKVYDIKALIPDAKVIGRTFEGGGLRLPKYSLELVATELAAHYRRDV
jgi:phosphoribosylformylglycinamidine (FGAM) synthase-like enzyme